jgi:hypothetical protein
LTVADDDQPVGAHPGTLQFSQASYSGDEDKGPVVLMVDRSDGTDGSLTVQVATTVGSAVAGVNYAPVLQTLTFAPGETAKSIPIGIIRDRKFGGDLSVGVVLRNVSGGGTLGARASASLIIHNVDSPPPVTLSGGRTISDRRKNVTQIVLRFSDLVNPVQAAKTTNYRLATAGKKGSFDAKGFKIIKLRSAAYSPSNKTVTLTLAKPLKISKTVQLRINGTSPSALSDVFGRLIDGNRDGQPGGNAIALLDRRGITISGY